MTNLPLETSEDVTWSALAAAATRGLSEHGYHLTRTPGRERSNVWRGIKDKTEKTISIRTTRDRWFAFVPQQNGARWKTLDNADLVVVAAVDDRENPQRIEVYLFEADLVRDRFN